MFSPSFVLALAPALVRGAGLLSPAAPNLTVHERRASVLDEAENLARTVETEGRKMPRGFYVAFDRDPRIAYATSACDDDGDYVVAVSDALLRVITYVAEGEAASQSFLRVLLRTPRASRLPVPGAFSDGAATTPEDVHAHYTRIVRAILTAEMSPLARPREDDIAPTHRCAAPTETREAGDDEWTADEQRAAWAMANRTHRGRNPRDLPPDMQRFLTMSANTVYLSAYAAWNGVLAGSQP